MKKLLSILGAAGLVATTSATVVSCEKKSDDNKIEETKKLTKENAESLTREVLDKIDNKINLEFAKGLTKEADESGLSPVGKRFNELMREIFLNEGYSVSNDFRFATNKAPSDDYFKNGGKDWSKKAELRVYLTEDQKETKLFTIDDVTFSFVVL